MKNETQALDSTIIGALISAAMTGVTSALSGTLSLLNTKTPISCGLVNNSPYELTRVTEIYEPVHGYLKVAPSSAVLDLLHGAKKDAEQWEESNYTTWGLDGRGSGTELLTVYRMKEINIVIAIYAGNPVTGAPYAGVSVSDEKWFTENQKRHSNDHKGKWLVDHIKNIHTANCQYSTNGKPCIASTTDKRIAVEFASAEETLFKIKFNGDWEPFQPSA